MGGFTLGIGVISAFLYSSGKTPDFIEQLIILQYGVANSTANSFKNFLGKSLIPNDFLENFSIILYVSNSVVSIMTLSSGSIFGIVSISRGGYFLHILAKYSFIISFCSQGFFWESSGILLRFN